MRQTLLNTSVASLPMSAMQSQLASVQLGTELSFVIIAIQIFITYLEFYIVGALAIVFIPFLASSHTRFLGDKVMPAIMGAGAKLMVLAFIMSATIPYLVRSQARAADIVTQMLDSNSGESIETLATSLAIAFLCWQGPSMASSLMAGVGSSSSAGSAKSAAQGMSEGAALGGGSVGGRAAKAMENVQDKVGGMLGKATGGDKGH